MMLFKDIHGFIPDLTNLEHIEKVKELNRVVKGNLPVKSIENDEQTKSFSCIRAPDTTYPTTHKKLCCDCGFTYVIKEGKSNVLIFLKGADKVLKQEREDGLQKSLELFQGKEPSLFEAEEKAA